jgi:uncharacterized protein (TIGR03435 family)
VSIKEAAVSKFLGPLLLCASLALAQTVPVRFEVASIRRAAPLQPGDGFGRRSGGPGTNSPDKITWRYAFTGSLVMQAYGVDYTRFKGPERIMSGSLDSEWDIQATVPAGSKPEDIPKMLLALLVDRFGLKAHWETEERAIYRMTVAKGGVKVKLGESDGARAYATVDRAPGGGRLIHAVQYSMQDVASMAARELGEPGAIVQDETGLTGVFTADLAYENFKTALEQDWGMKLERGKGPVQVLVVDEIREEPTDN